MKIIYEQGDVVFNSNTQTCGIVIGKDTGEQVRTIECLDTFVIVNNPPKSALTYCGHVDFKKLFRDIVQEFEQDHKKAKGDPFVEMPFKVIQPD